LAMEQQRFLVGESRSRPPAIVFQSHLNSLPGRSESRTQR
jgi:hypothetical protein